MISEVKTIPLKESLIIIKELMIFYKEKSKDTLENESLDDVRNNVL